MYEAINWHFILYTCFTGFTREVQKWKDDEVRFYAFSYLCLLVFFSSGKHNSKTGKAVVRFVHFWKKYLLLRILRTFSIVGWKPWLSLYNLYNSQKRQTCKYKWKNSHLENWSENLFTNHWHRSSLNLGLVSVFFCLPDLSPPATQEKEEKKYSDWSILCYMFDDGCQLIAQFFSTPDRKRDDQRAQS